MAHPNPEARPPRPLASIPGRFSSRVNEEKRWGRLREWPRGRRQRSRGEATDPQGEKYRSPLPPREDRGGIRLARTDTGPPPPPSRLPLGKRVNTGAKRRGRAKGQKRERDRGGPRRGVSVISRRHHQRSCAPPLSLSRHPQ
ncbi:hypothetical protein NL676_012537 [Syzygium grande]|nr:hypothetical protein NL676_012537 [Syzygium grande]